jgi:hypothetical protein
MHNQDDSRNERFGRERNPVENRGTLTFPTKSPGYEVGTRASSAPSRETAGHSLFRRNPQATKSGPERRRLHPEQGRRAIVVGERSLVALPVAQTSDKRRQTGSIADHEMIGLGVATQVTGVARKGNADKGSGGVTTADRSGKRMETTGIEPATSWLQTRRSALL